MNENFSNGLQKLYNCVSKGLGSIMIPQEVRNIIDKEAKQIDMLEMDGGITDKAISLCNDMEQPLGEVKELYRRTCSRMLYQEMRKQKNIEDVVNEAKAILQDENEVADEVVNEDWLMRFFNSIQDISNTDMQKLWGKVLAGEIKSPNSFTLRSLDTLSKITKQEATLFEELRPYIINYRGTFAILNDDEINKKLLFMGWTVIRFWGKDIKNNTDECIKVIEEAIFEMKLGENEILDAIEYDCK